MPKIVTDEQVYAAAIQTIIERGYAGATTRQMADAAQISEVTLFRKYGSKAELVKQVMQHMVAALDFATAARYTGDATADLLRVVTLYQGKAARDGRFLYTMLVEIPRQPELAILLETPLAHLDHIGQLLARYQAEGILKQEHPLHALAGLIGPLIAVNILREASAGLPLPPPDLASLVAHFLHGRLLPPAG